MSFRELIYLEKNFLDKNECDSIKSLLIGNPPKKSLVGSGHADLSRESFNLWIERSDLTAAIFEKIEKKIILINESYGFDINLKLNYLQLTQYSQDNFYNWHTDYGINSEFKKRKLSFVIQLSAPEDYSGGTLDFVIPTPSRYWRDQGSLIVFPSFLPHKVSPIIDGLRFSLVGWVEGPCELK